MRGKKQPSKATITDPSNRVAECNCGHTWKLRGFSPSRCPACGNTSALKVNGAVQVRKKVA